MKVCIISIKEIAEVVGTTYFGNFTMRWVGANPAQNQEYDVELEIETALSWNKDISLSTVENSNVSEENGFITLTGQLESVENDGYAVLRMGDSIIPFIAEGKAFEVGSMINITVDSILAYPVSY